MLLPLVLILPFFGLAEPPNFIVMQPDDSPFFSQWTPPPHFRGNNPEGANMPHLERFRNEGLQMMRASAASSLCAPSRYSTITGYYPSRAARGKIVSNERAKLDCSTNPNTLPSVMQQNGYATALVGKWHLDNIYGYPYDYNQQVQDIENCGFDVASGIYPHNVGIAFTGGNFSHNTEYVTSKAIEFISSAVTQETPFFLYFNPSSSHPSGSVLEALTEFSCRDTPEGHLDNDPVVPGLTDAYNDNCTTYRKTVIERATSDTNEALGAVWIDDCVGALLNHLEAVGHLNNTFFLFQLDHGKEGKGSLYEQGTRVARFVHYPDVYAPGSVFDGLVSTIDIGPTILDYAGISQLSPGWYEMDGTSWRTHSENLGSSDWNDRCVFGQMQRDRSITSSYELMNLCDSRGNYVTSPRTSLEGTAVRNQNVRRNELRSLLRSFVREL